MGQFSWFTQDTKKQIGNEPSNQIGVYMFDDEGSAYYDEEYEGYGEFEGKDFYELLAEMNGYTEKNRKDYKPVQDNLFDELRSVGIDMYYDPEWDKKGYKSPALFENTSSAKGHDFTKRPEDDPNQGWPEDEECGSCYGEGETQDQCYECRGEGQIDTGDLDEEGDPIWEECSDCEGYGEVMEECQDCGGEGTQRYAKGGSLIEGMTEKERKEWEKFLAPTHNKDEFMKKHFTKKKKGKKKGYARGGDVEDMLNDKNVSFGEFFNYLMEKDEGDWDSINGIEVVRMYIDDMNSKGVNVEHIEKAIEENPSSQDVYWIWLGNSMETPSPINNKQDLVEALELDNYAKGGVPANAKWEYPIYFNSDGKEFVAIYYSHEEDVNEADEDFDNRTYNDLTPDVIKVVVWDEDLGDNKWEEQDVYKWSTQDKYMNDLGYALETSSISPEKVEYAKGGKTLSREKIVEVLKDKLEDVLEDANQEYEGQEITGEEVEYKSRDGFIPYTDGGYEYRFFAYGSHLTGSGTSLPTNTLDAELERQQDVSREYAQEEIWNENKDEPEFIKKFPKPASVNWNDLEEYDPDFAAEFDDLSRPYDDTIMFEIEALYYKPENDRGIGGQHTIVLTGNVNMETPYHRTGNLEDYMSEKFTFHSITDLEEELDFAIRRIEKWFDGDKYKQGKELTMSRYAKGGKIEKDIAKFKKQLISKEKSRGLYENFGRKEVRKINEKYDAYERDDMGVQNATKIQEFSDWASSYGGFR